MTGVDTCRPPDSGPCRRRSRARRCRGATRDRWAGGLAGGGSRRSACRPPTPHRPAKATHRPSGAQVAARVGVERPGVEHVEAVERDDGRVAGRAVLADRDDHELGVAGRGVRRTGHPAEQQPRSVRRPRRTRVVGRIRSGYLEPAGVLARPDEVDVATALVGVDRHPPVRARPERRDVRADGCGLRRRTRRAPTATTAATTATDAAVARVAAARLRRARLRPAATKVDTSNASALGWSSTAACSRVVQMSSGVLMPAPRFGSADPGLPRACGARSRTDS